MKKFYKLILLLTTILFYSCEHIHNLYSDLSTHKPTLGYIHEKTNLQNYQTKDSVIIKLTGLGLAKELLISKTGVIVVPLVFFNLATTKATVTLGQSHLANDYNEFFINSIEKESMRNGCFVSGNTESDSSYVLTINLNKILVNSNVKKGNYLVLLPIRTLAWGSFTKIKEAECRLSFEASLMKNSKLIYSKEYNIKSIQPFLYLPSGNSDRVVVLEDNMAECLSLSTKELIDQLVSDLNQVIGKN